MASQPISIERPTWKKEYLALVCGIANASGGTLTLTSPDSGRIAGSKKMRRTIYLVPEQILSTLGITCTAEPVMHNGSLCLEIVIPASVEPIDYEGNYYLYKDGKNTVKTREEIELLHSDDSDIAWEISLNETATLANAEPAMVARFIEGISHKNSNDQSGQSTNLSNEVLTVARLKDTRSNTLTNAGTLLLSSEPDRSILGATVRIGFFDSSGYTAQQTDEVRGTLLFQLEHTVDLLFEKYIGLALGNQPAQGVPSPAMFYEVIRNALVHKDYESGLPITVSVYPGRIVVANTGRPPESWSEEDLVDRHISRPRNPVLAAALQDVGEFSGWGNGIASMIQACESEGLQAPEFQLRADETVVTFTFSTNAGSAVDVLPEIEEVQDSDLAEQTNETPGSEANHEADMHKPSTTRQRIVQPTNAKNALFRERSLAAANDLNLTSTDEYVLKVLAANGRATAVSIADFLKVSESTVRRSFRKLRELELIERVGSDKAGYWKLLF